MRGTSKSTINWSRMLAWMIMLVILERSAAFPSGAAKSHPNIKKSFLEDAMTEMEYGDKHKGGTANHHKIDIKATAAQHHKDHKHPQKYVRSHDEVPKKDTFVARIFPSRELHENGAKVNHEPETTPSLRALPKTLVSTLKKAQTDNKAPSKKQTMESAQKIAVKALAGVVKSNGESQNEGDVKSFTSETHETNIEGMVANENKDSTKSELDSKTLHTLQDIVEKLLKHGVHQTESKGNTQIQGTIKTDDKLTSSKDAASKSQDEQGTSKESAKEASLQTKGSLGKHDESGYQITPVYRLKALNNTNTADEKDPEKVHDAVNALSKDEQDFQKRHQQELKKLQQQAQDLLVAQEKEQLLQQQQESSKTAVNVTNGQANPGEPQNDPTLNPAKDSSVVGYADTTNGDKLLNKDMDVSALKSLPKDILAKLIAGLLNEKKQKTVVQVPKQLTESRKAFETARKLVKAAYAREQLYKAEQDFFEKVKEMMNKTDPSKQGMTQSKLGPLEEDDAMSAMTKSSDVNAAGDSAVGKTETPRAKSLSSASSLPLSTLTNSNLLGPQGKTTINNADQKQYDEAAHMEEKVAEQQDQMYESLIHQTLSKSLENENADDDDDTPDDEQGVARDTQYKPNDDDDESKDEDYGDFQDKDEEPQKKSVTHGATELRNHVSKPVERDVKTVRYSSHRSVENSGSGEGDKRDNSIENVRSWSGSGE